MIAKRYDAATADQKRAMEKIVKVAVARAEEIAKDRSGAVAKYGVSNVDAVERLVTDLKTRMPRTKEERTPGVWTQAAPHGISQHLHST